MKRGDFTELQVVEGDKSADRPRNCSVQSVMRKVPTTDEKRNSKFQRNSKFHTMTIAKIGWEKGDKKNTGRSVR